MKQALHIFKKDFRRLWPQMIVVLVAIRLFSFLFRPVVSAPGELPGIGGLLMIVSVWLLIARAVHLESQIGDNEFWRTRPYSRASLIAAKVLLVLLCIMLPLFLSDCAMLHRESLDVWSNPGELLLWQLRVAAWLILPPFAIATVTRGIVDDVLIWLALGLALGIGVNIETPLVSVVAKYPLGLAVLVLLAVVWRQFAHGRPLVSRALIAAALLLSAFGGPTDALFALERARTGQPPDADAIAFAGLAANTVQIPAQGCSAIPVLWTGLKPGWNLELLAVKAAVNDENSSNTKWVWPGWGQHMRLPGNLLPLCGAYDDRYAGKDVTLHISLALSLLADEASYTAQLTNQPIAISDGGYCQVERRFDLAVSRTLPRQIVCRAPAWRRREIATRFQNSDGGIEFRGWDTPQDQKLSGFPFSLNPVSEWIAVSNESVIAESMEKQNPVIFTPATQVAVLRRDFTIQAAMAPLDPNALPIR